MILRSNSRLWDKSDCPDTHSGGACKDRNGFSGSWDWGLQRSTPSTPASAGAAISLISGFSRWAGVFWHLELSNSRVASMAKALVGMSTQQMRETWEPFIPCKAAAAGSRRVIDCTRALENPSAGLHSIVKRMAKWFRLGALSSSAISPY